MARCAWLRLIVPGLCLGTLPACLATNPGGGLAPLMSRPRPATPMWRPDGMMVRRETVFVPLTPDAPAAPNYGATIYHETGKSAGPATVLPPTPKADPGPDTLKPPPVNADKPAPVKSPARPDGEPESSRQDPTPLNEVLQPYMLPTALADEPPLLACLRGYLDKRDEAARDALRQLDPAQREILTLVLPFAVKVGEGTISRASPQDVAVLVDQLQGLLWSLRPRAALVMDKFCFCRQIRKFGAFEALEEKPTFRPGEMVEIYAEIRNISSQVHRSSRGDYRTHLRGRLEIHAPGSEIVLAREWDKPDETVTPQHDYFQHYRFQMPSVTPGAYTLYLEAVDVPTGRKVRQKLEFRVTSKDQ